MTKGIVIPAKTRATTTKVLVLLSLIITIPAFATDPDPAAQKTVASKAYVDTKQDKIPAGSYGANSSVVTYDSTTGEVQERWILGAGTMDETDPQSGAAFYNSVLRRFDQSTGHLTGSSFGELDDGTVVTRDMAENSLIPAKYVASALSYKQDRISAGTAGNVVTYTGTLGQVGSVATANAATYDSQTGALSNGTNIATIAAVDTRQKKMTCAGWDSDTHTDEHCWLWSIAE
ncbi:MAG: hypothetical protein J5714_04060 [Alphaproteobacteria bacterium]|nr:hypothetical protein [Alphaproteobacteria bacterium]